MDLHELTEQIDARVPSCRGSCSRWSASVTVWCCCVRIVPARWKARSSERTSQPAAQLCRADPGLVDALGRCLDLSASSRDQAVLGPLVAEEIHYRLLTAPVGVMLRTLSRPDSSVSAVAQAIGHLRADLSAPVVVPELARRVGMSPSAFHQHFKAVTATTPLQYQKELRLLAARQLLAAGRSVTAAAFEVGYASSSQFSREYVRKFGVPPSRDEISA